MKIKDVEYNKVKLGKDLEYKKCLLTVERRTDMNNFAKNVLEMEQVKDLVSKIKGEDKKKHNLTWLWILLAVVAVAGVVAFLVVRYFCTEEEYLDEDEWDLLDDEEEEDEESLAEKAADAVEDVKEAVKEAAEDLKG